MLPPPGSYDIRCVDAYSHLRRRSSADPIHVRFNFPVYIFFPF